MKEHKIAKWKPKIVEEIVSLASKYPTVAAIDMENLPSKQLQSIRAKIKDKAVIKMTRKRLMKRALENTPAKELLPHLKGLPALLFSDLNAFELFNILKENMSDAPAKAGQEAPEDILVPAGPTPFAPGPIISELGNAGIKATIKEGKVVILKDTVVAEKGAEISEAAAAILSRLGVTPMKIGITLHAALEGNEIYTLDTLDIDVDKYVTDLLLAHQNAYKLAVGLGILTADTVIPQIQKAHLEAKALALSQNILADEVKEKVLSKVDKQVEKLKKSLPEAPKEKTEPKEEVKEAKTEEKPKKEKVEEAKPKEKIEELKSPKLKEKKGETKSQG